VSLPAAYLINKKPRLITKFAKASLFYIFVLTSFELTALYLNQWRFTGEFIWLIPIFGTTLPIEEFVFWIILGTPVGLAYYELYMDDGK